MKPQSAGKEKKTDTTNTKIVYSVCFRHCIVVVSQIERICLLWPTTKKKRRQSNSPIEYFRIKTYEKWRLFTKFAQKYQQQQQIPILNSERVYPISNSFPYSK